TGNVPSDGRDQPVDGMAKIVGGGDLSVGLFRGEGSLYVMITNRDYKAGTVTKMTVNVGKKGRAVEQLDLATNRWHPVQETKDRNNILTLSFTLDPSGAALFRW